MRKKNPKIPKTESSKMSGEWGGSRSSPFPPLSSTMKKTKNFEELAKAAKAALQRLNSLIKESGDWREERAELESKVIRLSGALRALSGRDPGEITRPDPVTVRQREEILRLETAEGRLEDEVRRLRISLLESDRAITCSGAKMLKEKMRRSRDEEARRRLDLGEQIVGLKARLGEAQGESSCAGLNRLRKKLRDILRNDRKIDRVVAGVAENGCSALSRLTEELKSAGAALGREENENSRLCAENGGLRSALDHAEEKASGLVERVEELEGALDESRREFDDTTSVRNELIGAKLSFKVKAEEVEELRGAKRELEELEKRAEARERHLDDLQRRLEAASSMANDFQRLRDETEKVKRRVIDLEIERDGLVEEVQKMGSIVSERNEQIVRILGGNEARERAGKAEIEELKSRLSLKSCCENLADGPTKLGAADPEVKDIVGDGGNDSASKDRVDGFQASKLELENELVAVRGRILETERSRRTELEEMSRENNLLKSEAQKLVAGFVRELEKLKIENIRIASSSEKEIGGLRAERNALRTELEELAALEELRIGRRASKSTETGEEELTRSREEIERALRDVSSLTSENKELRETVEREKRLRKDVEMSRKTSDRVDKKPEVMEYGDYVLADRELKYHIHLQSLAVKRILDFIRYVDVEGRVKPAMATFLEPSLTNSKVLNLDENVTTTFRMSRKLSERIFETELDVQRLERLRREREDHDNLKKRVKIMIDDGRLKDIVESQNLLLKEEEGEEDADEKIMEINSRITVLQDQIKSKQSEAGERLIEMRETMRQERIRLMEIADVGNVPHSEQVLASGN